MSSAPLPPGDGGGTGDAAPAAGESGHGDQQGPAPTITTGGEEDAPGDPSPVADDATPATALPSESTKRTKEWKGSADAASRRDGYHPITGLRVYTCGCPNPKQCREIMWRYAEIGDKEMCTYLRLPGHPQKSDTPNGKHIVQFRENVFHHLFGQGSNDIKDGMKSKVTLVAYHHFDKRMHPYLAESTGPKLDRFRIPYQLGKECGLTDRDRCKVGRSKVDTNNPDAGRTFFASPTIRPGASLDAVERAEIEHELRKAAANPQPTAAPALPQQTGRKTPREREIERFARDAESNPLAAAINQCDQAEEIERLREALKQSEKKSAEYKAKLEEKISVECDGLTQRLIHSGGLNRWALLSDSYHEKKPWVAKFLFSRPWNQHKARGRACFGDWVPDFDCNVTLEGDDPPITPFEKYCMACMIVWQGFLYPTVAAIYNRTDSSVSRYMAEWMPLLGKAGSYMSELDLNMNHNYLPIDVCKANGVPYMENGVAMLNGEPWNPTTSNDE